MTKVYSPKTATEAKPLFTYAQLSTAFGINREAIIKRLEGLPIHSMKINAPVFELNVVADLKDVRDPLMVAKYRGSQPNLKDKYGHIDNEYIDEDDDYIEQNPRKMKPLEKINYYKAEDLRQSAKLKSYKSDVESGKLMVAVDVEKITAEAFKKIALTLYTLPDLLEREGIIGSSDIQKVIDVLDGARLQLVSDLKDLNSDIEEVNNASY